MTFTITNPVFTFPKTDCSFALDKQWTTLQTFTNPETDQLQSATIDYTIYARHTIVGDNTYQADQLILYSGHWPEFLSESDELMPDATVITVEIRSAHGQELLATITIPVLNKIMALPFSETGGAKGLPRTMEQKVSHDSITGTVTITRGDSGEITDALDDWESEGVVTLEIAATYVGSLMPSMEGRGAYGQLAHIEGQLTLGVVVA